MAQCGFEQSVFLSGVDVSGSPAFGKALNIFNRYVRENYPVFNADLAWKYDHTLRVVSICSQLLKQAVSVFCGTGGEEILLGAALFHDIGRFVQFSKDNAEKKPCMSAAVTVLPEPLFWKRRSFRRIQICIPPTSGT